MKKRRFLIMTASIGSGHIKAAEAVGEELRKKYPQDEILTIDYMSENTSAFNGFLKKLYLRMLAFVPNLYDVCYKVSGGGESGILAQNMFAVTTYRTMKRILRKYRPDVIICTHPFPEGAAALCKRMGHGGFQLAAVLTDYSLHQIWIYPQVDFYFTATEDMRKGLIRMGFSEEAVFAPGIAVADGLGDAFSREEARWSLELAEEEKVLLLMGGGLGLGGMQETLKELEKSEEHLTLLVVAGHNPELFERVMAQREKSHHRILVWAYTDKVNQLMAASDLLITKPGALTMSEAFVHGLPMLLHEPIPGPETENAVYASERGAAVWLRHGDSLSHAVREIFSDKEKLRKMQEAARNSSKPHAAHEIVEKLSSFLLQSE